MILFFEGSWVVLGMSCWVYLGRLFYGIRECDIDKFFCGYGKLWEINLKNGYGFVVSYCDFVCFLVDFMLWVFVFFRLKFCNGLGVYGYWDDCIN